MARMNEAQYKMVVKGQIRLAMETLNTLLVEDQSLSALEGGLSHALGQLQSAEIMAFRADLLSRVERPPSPNPAPLNNVIQFMKRGA
jgi:hypothetical protein